MPVDASENLYLSGKLSRLIRYRTAGAEYLACSENFPKKEKLTQTACFNWAASLSTLAYLRVAKVVKTFGGVA